MRWLIGVVAVFLVALGLGCLNYTRAYGWEHHTEVARQWNLPRPSIGILYSGALSLIAGSAALGYMVGRSRSKENR
jgi:hypothetical protein